MKKKVIISLAVVISIIVIVLLIIFNKPEVEVTVYTMDEYVKLIGPNIKEEVKENYIIKDYEDYTRIIDSNVLVESDFENNNYVLLDIKYDPCSEDNLIPYEHSFSGNEINIKVAYTASCGLCAQKDMYYLMKVSKNINYVDIQYDFTATNKIECDSNIEYKPIIYLYPTEEMDISVKLVDSNRLDLTYPKYNGLWSVHAYSDGRLIDNNTNRELYGLYWQGKNHYARVMDDGFVVKGEDTIAFLEEKLEYLGLNERESEEFIIYWLPKLEKNKYNYIRFETMDEINNYMRLDVDPSPDTIIRVYMNFKALDKYINVKEQRLTSVKRSGYTLVEWGGSEM